MCRQNLLQRNELRRVSSTNTRAVVLHGLVSQRKFTQVVTNHLSLDLNVVETLPVVNTNNRTNHLRNNYHVTKMSLHRLRTLILRSVRLLNIHFIPFYTYSNAQSLYQSLGLSLKTTTETTTSTRLSFNYIIKYTSTSSIKSFRGISNNLSKSTPR